MHELRCLLMTGLQDPRRSEIVVEHWKSLFMQKPDDRITEKNKRGSLEKDNREKTSLKNFVDLHATWTLFFHAIYC